MIHRILGLVLTGLALATPASAHPHVFVTMKTELIYAPDGAIAAVRHAWTFDDMFSIYATQGIDQAKKGQFSRDELAPLAQTNIESLKEYGYFTRAKVEGVRKKGAFAEPVDYFLSYADDTLTLHFTLPFKTPLKAKNLEIEIYDPEFFIDFTFVDEQPVMLRGAPAQCTVEALKPSGFKVTAAQRLDKMFQASEANAGMGAQFANKIEVKCP